MIVYLNMSVKILILLYCKQYFISICIYNIKLNIISNACKCSLGTIWGDIVVAITWGEEIIYPP